MLYKKGDYINSYMVSFPHKQGSYAETYRVKDSSGRTKFLKLISYARLRPEQLNDEAKVVEVEVTKILCHHNLCEYVDSGQLMIDGQQYAFIVTNFVSGETLSQRIARDGSLSVYDTKLVAKALLSALGYLHSLEVPVIHNEVTIQNTMLNLIGGMGDLKLIDFGHARFLNQPLSMPNLDELNLFYLAPERFNGTCCVQSDLFSVGVLMYQCLFGELPWFVDVSRVSKKDRVDFVLAQRDKELGIPDRNLFELNDQLINTICKAMSYDVSDRFQSADEFIKAIDGDVKIERQSTRRKILSEDIEDKKSFSKQAVKKGEGFSAVAGMQGLKEKMRKDVIEVLQDPEGCKAYGISIPNGMLLYGPPGCGKTFFAKHFAEEVGFNYMCITPATLKSKWVNATQENIANMFKEAEEKAPTIIFIDEINELVPNRQSDIHEMSSSAVNEMLAQMDRTGEKGVFVVGATNYPDMIDPAILRAGRLDRKYYIGPPDKDARIAIFKMYLLKRPYDFGIDYEELADLTENYVSADIKLIVDDASREAYKTRGKITMDLLKSILTSTRPSLSKAEIAKYDAIKAKMDGQSTKNERPHIGFT